MKPETNESKLMTKRIKRADGVTLVLTYLKPEAAAMRALVASLRLRGDRKPSMSLIARRALGLYLDRIKRDRQRNPERFAKEMEDLSDMTAPLSEKTLRKDRLEAAP